MFVIRPETATRFWCLCLQTSCLIVCARPLFCFACPRYDTLDSTLKQNQRHMFFTMSDFRSHPLLSSALVLILCFHPLPCSHPLSAVCVPPLGRQRASIERNVPLHITCPPSGSWLSSLLGWVGLGGGGGAEATIEGVCTRACVRAKFPQNRYLFGIDCRVFSVLHSPHCRF